MRARIIRAYIAKPKNIPLISLISQQTVPRDKRDKRVIFPLDSHIYARGREKILLTQLPIAFLLARITYFSKKSEIGNKIESSKKKGQKKLRSCGASELNMKFCAEHQNV